MLPRLDGGRGWHFQRTTATHAKRNTEWRCAHQPYAVALVLAVGVGVGVGVAVAVDVKEAERGGGETWVVAPCKWRARR